MKPSFLVLLLTAVCSGWGQEVRLPQGFPDPLRTLHTRGPGFFRSLTTEAYTREARRLLLQEANQVATELSLWEEEVPLTENIVKFTIVPFGWAYVQTGHVGRVMSRHYHYVARKGWKFSELFRADLEAACANYTRSYRWSGDRLDTNAAYNLATQWLAAVSMDVAGLNRDCVMHAAPATHWNRFRWKPPFTNATFTPIYSVSWIPRQTTNGFAAAQVELFAPDKTLLSLRVEDPKYILRQPLTFTNLDELLASPTGQWQIRGSP